MSTSLPRSRSASSTSPTSAAICAGSTGRDLHAALTPAATFEASKGSTLAVALAHLQRHLFDPLEGGEATAARHALAAATDGGAVVGLTGVDDLVSRPPQAGQRMRATVAAAGQGTGSAERPGRAPTARRHR